MGHKFLWSPGIGASSCVDNTLEGRTICREIYIREALSIFYKKLFAPLRPHYYKSTDGRGFRAFSAKFASLQVDVQGMLETGNESKYGVELSSIH